MAKVIKKGTDADYFEAVASGQKSFEVRLADWQCQPGDSLLLVEKTQPANKPTGRSLQRRVSYVIKTKDFNFFTPAEIAEHGYQIIALQNPLPQIRIKNAWLLRNNVSKHLHQLYGQGKKLASLEQVEAKVKDYRQAWQPLEEKILSAMGDLLGLSFRQNIIDVYIAPYFKAFSDPIVIGNHSPADAFVDLLTHELLHRLLTDNTTVPYQTDFLSQWQKLFGKEHSSLTTVHIPVHAVHKAIYLDILKQPSRLERNLDIIKRRDATDYQKAWDYVDKHGYHKIIEKLKQSYQKLGGV